MKKKGLILPRHFFFSAIVFTLIITSVVAIITMVKDGSTGDKRDAIPDLLETDRINEYNKTLNVVGYLTIDLDRLESDIKNLKVENFVDGITLPLAVIQTAWSMIIFMTQSFGFMGSAINGLSSILGVPTWVPTLGLLIISVLFIFSILTLIFGKDT